MFAMLWDSNGLHFCKLCQEPLRKTRKLTVHVGCVGEWTREHIPADVQAGAPDLPTWSVASIAVVNHILMQFASCILGESRRPS